MVVCVIDAAKRVTLMRDLIHSGVDLLLQMVVRVQGVNVDIISSASRYTGIALKGLLWQGTHLKKGCLNAMYVLETVDNRRESGTQLNKRGRERLKAGSKVRINQVRVDFQEYN